MAGLPGSMLILTRLSLIGLPANVTVGAALDDRGIFNVLNRLVLGLSALHKDAGGVSEAGFTAGKVTLVAIIYLTSQNT